MRELSITKKAALAGGGLILIVGSIFGIKKLTKKEYTEVSREEDPEEKKDNAEEEAQD